MTGPGPGKLNVEAKVVLITPYSIKTLDANVYIHVKGYSLARVTHLDIECPVLNDIIKPRSSGFFPLIGTSRGFKVSLDRTARGVKLIVESKLLTGTLLKDGEKTWVYVGGKEGGIFLGFKKEYIKRLEKIAIEVYGVQPK